LGKLSELLFFNNEIGVSSTSDCRLLDEIVMAQIGRGIWPLFLINPLSNTCFIINLAPHYLKFEIFLAALPS
jgi:hypothetical protein